MKKDRAEKRKSKGAGDTSQTDSQVKKAKVEENTLPQGIKEVDLVSKGIRRATATTHVQNQDKRLIVVLEDAHLETVKTSQGFGLLNVDEHTGILRKNNRDFGTARPDITHQCLLMLLDSPLNRSGLLQVYIHTAKNVLIEVNPQTRIPRTFKRFAGLIVQLLHKFSVKASDSSVKLLKVIKNPIEDHLPVGCKRICMSYAADKVTSAREFVESVPKDEPVCVVIGAIAKGNINVSYTEEDVRIGNFPLSAALTCTKLCSAFEESWGVL